MKTAPRDGTLIRLYLRDGSDFVGRYSDKWFGWIDRSERCPLIRGDIRFAGWEPINETELRRIRQQSLIRPEQQAKHRGFIVVPETATEARPAKIRSAIVVARKPRPRR